ncbi:ferrous iron transport protein A [Breoghania sp.]|uniref:FeoA family protein n=1 Tax=Breoghania sp. TaxID=2065378 RepID=UPI0037488E65
MVVGVSRSQASETDDTPAASVDAVSARPARGSGFPLTMAVPGHPLRLVSYACGRNSQRKLGDMGLTVGVALAVVSAEAGGPLIVALRGTRVGVSMGLAHKIMVVEAKEG